MVRTLNSDLTTAQQAATGTPYIHLLFHSFDRSTTRSYKTDDSTNRVLFVQQAEGRFGSFTLVEGRPLVISSIIRLQNSDNSLSSLDFRGYRVYIEWGFNTLSGNKTDRSGPEFVVSQELWSDEGVNYLELYTINLWEFANQIFKFAGNTFPLEWIRGGNNETKIGHILLELLGGGALEDATADDGGSFTDYTAKSASGTSSDPNTIFPTTPAVNDAFYFGHSVQFDRISIDVTQILSSGSMTVDWEYSKGGSAWGTLSPLTGSDGGNTTPGHINFTATGIQIDAFNIPSDWAVDTVDSGTSMYFIRARVSSISSPSQAVQAARMFVGKDFGFALDTTTSGQGDALLPIYQTTVDQSIGSVVADIMAMTTLGIKVREDGFHAFKIDINQASPDEIYDLDDGPHKFFIHTESQQVIMPNRILVISSHPPATYANDETDSTVNDSVSQLEVGIIPQIIIDPSVVSNAEALTAAAARMDQLQYDRNQTRIEVPLHCGQEVWDEIRVQDDRTGHTSPGSGQGNAKDSRVSQLIRSYRPGEYRMQIITGGLIWGVGQLPVVSVPIEGVAGAPFEVVPFLFPEPLINPFNPQGIPRVTSPLNLPIPIVRRVPDPRVVPTPRPQRTPIERANEVIRRQGAAPPGLGIPVDFDVTGGR